MKLSRVLLAMLLAFAIGACSKSPKKLIVGEWELIEMGGEKPPEGALMQLTFAKDGKMMVKGTRGEETKSLSGTYEWVDDDTIKTKTKKEGSDRETTEVCDIVSLTTAELVLKYPSGEKMKLKKNK